MDPSLDLATTGDASGANDSSRIGAAVLFEKARRSSRRSSYATVATIASDSSRSSDEDLPFEVDDIEKQQESTPVDPSSPLFDVLPCAMIFFAAHLFNLLHVQPHQRPMPMSGNNTVWHPEHAQEFEGETVDGNMLSILVLYIPMTIQILLSYYYPGTNSNDSRVRSVVQAASTWLTAMGLCDLVTSGVKLYAGYLRPIFLTICQPDSNGDCTGISRSREQYLHTSFPSGHASLSFCGMLLLSQFLKRVIEKQHGSKRRTVSYKLALLCSYAPMLMAIFISTSRVHDNKHFPADVIAGALLGGSIAKIVHGIWYGQVEQLGDSNEQPRMQ